MQMIFDLIKSYWQNNNKQYPDEFSKKCPAFSQINDIHEIVITGFTGLDSTTIAI